MATSHIEKLTKRAKQIRKGKEKKMTWQAALKAAGREMKKPVRKTVKKSKPKRKVSGIGSVKKKATKVVVRAKVVKISGMGAVGQNASQMYNQCVSGIRSLDTRIASEKDSSVIKKLRAMRSGMMTQKNFYKKFL